MRSGARVVLFGSDLEALQASPAALTTSGISGGSVVFGPAPVYVAGSYTPTISNSGSYVPTISKTNVGD